MIGWRAAARARAFREHRFARRCLSGAGGKGRAASLGGEVAGMLRTLAAGGVVIGIGAFWFEFFLELRDRAEIPRPGVMVECRSGKRHVVTQLLSETDAPRGRAGAPRAEEAGPVVVCISGLDETTDAWRPLMDSLAERGVPSLAYDRAGIAYSEPAPLSPPADLEVEDFVDVLSAAAAGSGEVLLVGAGSGALLARHLSRSLLDGGAPVRAVGLVLVDGIEENVRGEQRKVSAAAAGALDGALASARAQQGMAYFGLMRTFLYKARRGIEEAYGDPLTARRVMATRLTPKHRAAVARETAALAEWEGRAAALPAAVPMVVVTHDPGAAAAQHSAILAAQPAGALPSDDFAAMERCWTAAQERLARGAVEGAEGELVIVPGCAGQIHLRRPEALRDAVARALELAGPAGPAGRRGNF